MSGKRGMSSPVKTSAGVAPAEWPALSYALVHTIVGDFSTRQPDRAIRAVAEHLRRRVHPDRC